MRHTSCRTLGQPMCAPRAAFMSSDLLQRPLCDRAGYIARCVFTGWRVTEAKVNRKVDKLHATPSADRLLPHTWRRAS